MASGPNTSWQTDGEKVETMEDLNFFSKITVDGESSHGGGGGGLVTKSCPTLATPWAVASQSPLSLGFSRHEYWIGFPFPSPGNLPDPGIDPGSTALQADSLPTELRGKPQIKRHHEIKRCFFLARKAMTNLDHIIKSRDITLTKEVCLVKAMIFPGVMCGCERWTVKKAEHWKIDAVELWCWRRLLRVSWIERRSNQSFLKGINPEYSWEYLMLKLKLQTFGHLMGRADSLVKTLMLGKMEGKKKRRQQRMRCLDGITDWMDMSLSQLQEMVKHREPGVLRIMGSQSEMTEQLNKSNNTELQTSKSKIYCKQWTKVNNTVLIWVAQF